MATKKSSAKGKVEKVMHEFKEGDLKSGNSNKKVKSRKQAIAIGLSEARAAGEDVPPPKKSASKKSTGRKKAATKKSAGTKKTAVKKNYDKKENSNKKSCP